MQKLSGFLPQAVKALKADKAVELHQLKLSWWAAVGPIIACQSEPLRLRGSFLYVITSSPAWSQEITLQQRLILSRLNKELKASLHKIVCRVGQPHTPRPSLQPSGRSKDTVVAWLDEPIPLHRQQTIEATLSQLTDIDQQKKLRPLLELSVRRELYLTRQGLLPCSHCATLCSPSQTLCRSCQREELDKARAHLLRFIARKPWLAAKEIQEHAPWAHPYEIKHLKDQLRSNLLLQIWQLTHELEGVALQKVMTPALIRLALQVTMLTCRLPEQSLSPRHFLYALGRRIGGAYLAHARLEQAL